MYNDGREVSLKGRRKFLGIQSNNKSFNNMLLFGLGLSILIIVLFVMSVTNLVPSEELQDIIAILGLYKLFAIGIFIGTLISLKKYNIDCSVSKLIKILPIIIGYILAVISMIYISPMLDDGQQNLVSTFAFTLLGVASCLLYKKLYSLDRKTQWREEFGTEKKVNTYHWRYNFKYSPPKKKYSFEEMKSGFNIQRAVLFIPLTYLIYAFTTVGSVLSNLLFIVIPLIVGAEIIESACRLAFNFEGVCTGRYTRKTRGGRIVRYTYIITNFHDKSEIKVNSKEALWITENAEVNLDFTLLTKRVLSYY